MMVMMMAMTFGHLAGCWEFLVHRNNSHNKTGSVSNTQSVHRRAKQRTQHPCDMHSDTCLVWGRSQRVADHPQMPQHAPGGQPQTMAIR
eukprot:11205108-Lingulodinium_polyedra.AAC.1